MGQSVPSMGRPYQPVIRSIIPLLGKLINSRRLADNGNSEYPYEGPYLTVSDNDAAALVLRGYILQQIRDLYREML